MFAPSAQEVYGFDPCDGAPEVLRSSTHTARKDHTTGECRVCGGPIRKGQRYRVEVLLADDFEVQKEHLGPCHLRYWGISEAKVAGEVRAAEDKKFVFWQTQEELFQKVEALPRMPRKVWKERVRRLAVVHECVHTGCLLYSNDTPVDPERHAAVLAEFRAQDEAEEARFADRGREW